MSSYTWREEQQHTTLYQHPNEPVCHLEPDTPEHVSLKDAYTRPAYAELCLGFMSDKTSVWKEGWWN